MRRVPPVNLILTVMLTLFLVFPSLSGKYDSVVRAFESKPNYVVPAATLLSSLTGNGWNQSSSLGKDFSFSLSLPITIAVLSDEDREYSDIYVPIDYANYINNYNANNPDHTFEWIKNPDPRISQPYTTATIFGKKSAPKVYDLNFDDSLKVVSTTEVLLSDGIENLAKFNWFPMAAIQLQWEFHNTALKLRASPFPGIGIQHDIRSFAPNTPLDITFFHNHSFQIFNWEPGNDIEGKLELRGNSAFTGFTMGKTFASDVVEIFLESGVEYSTLKTGGELYIKSDDEWVRPNLKIHGRSNFRVGLNITVTPGKKRHYSFSGSSGFGTGQHFTVNPVLINFQGQKRSSTVETNTKKSQ